MPVGIRAGLFAGVRASMAGVTPATFFGLIGDSQFSGAADPSKGDSAYKLSTPNTGVQFNGRYSAGAGVDPPVWTNFDTDLVMRSIAPHQSGTLMGPEITFASALQTAIPSPAIEEVGGNGYLLADNWLPTATFMVATTGKNLFNTWIDRMHTLEASTGKRTAGVFVNLGGNDANAGATKYNAFQANMIAINAAIRAAFGATLPIVWLRTHASTAIDATGLATVRAAMTTVAAADSRMKLIDIDDLQLLVDSIHFETSADITAGERAAFAMLDLLGYSRRTVTVPTVVGWGPARFGSGGPLPRSWGGTLDGDLEVMVAQNGILSGSAIATPAGWTAIGTLTTTGASGFFVNFNLFARALPAGTIAANNNHTPPTTVVATDNRNHAKIFCIRGPSALTLANIEAFNLWPENAFADPKTVPAITTLTDNAGVFVFSGGWCGSSARAQVVTNAAISSFTELQDGADSMPTTDALALALTAGTKTAHATTGTFSITMGGTGTMIAFAIVVAVKP